MKRIPRSTSTPWCHPMNKYRSKRTKYNGVTYHSKKEANYAFKLDLLIQAGELKGVERQVRIPLHAVGGKKVGYYIVDFKVTRPDNTVYYVEVKGFWTPLAKWKVKHFELEYPELELIIV